MGSCHEDLRRLMAYLRWADLRMIEAIQALPADRHTAEPVPGWGSLLATVGHMGDAMTIWARRIAGEPVSSRRGEADFPTLTDAARLLEEGHAALLDQLDRLTPEQLDAVWTYTNFAGESASLPLADVFRHVVNHGTYHRGQVASKIRLLGGQPPATDLVLWSIEQTRAALASG